MKFCCSIFESYYYIDNYLGFNIRLVKSTNPSSLEMGHLLFYKTKGLIKTKHKRRDLRFYITMGYENFNYSMPILNIGFCPFCGKNLFDFYKDDEYINEIEGDTFTV